MEEKISRNIKTYALGVGASLHVLFPENFLGIDNTMHSKKVAFVFKRTSEVEKAINAFYDNTLKIQPAALLDSVRTLKQRANDSI